MNYNLHNDGGYSVYPGEYHPLQRDIDRMKEDMNVPGEVVVEPDSTLIEDNDHYEIEIVAPGHHKDDFIISVDSGYLAVFALRHRPSNEEPPGFRRKELRQDCFEFSLQLPGDIDSDFACAEYNEGILRIQFPRSDHPGPPIIHRIIVY